MAQRTTPFAQDPGTYEPYGMDPYWSSVQSATPWLPANYLRNIAGIESAGGQNLTSGTGASGPFQFTGIAAKQVGLPKNALNDPFIGTAGAVQLADFNRGLLQQRLNRDPTPFELYMAHQQGGPGTATILASDPEATINRLPASIADNIMLQGVSGITRNSTIGDFVKHFSDKYAAQDAKNYPDPNSGGPPISPLAPGDPFNAGAMLPTFNYGAQRAGGGDVAGYDLTGIAFDRAGNALGNTAISGPLSDALASLREHYGAGPVSDADYGDSSQFAGRYAYAGDIRPQDAKFLTEMPTGWVTREGRQVLPTNYAPDLLGVDPDASDYAGRYSYSGPLDLSDALWLQQNPGSSIGTDPWIPGPRTTNDFGSSGVGAVDAGILNGFDTPRAPWTAPPNTAASRGFDYFLPTSALRGGDPNGEYTTWAPSGAQQGDFSMFGMGPTTGYWTQAPDGTEWSDYKRYGGSQGGDTMGGHGAYMQRAIAMYKQEQARAEAYRQQMEANTVAEQQRQQVVANNNQTMINNNIGMLNPSGSGTNPLGGYDPITGITGAITPIINGAPWTGGG